MLDLPVYDTQCGAKLFRAEALDTVVQEPFASRWIFDVELILRMKRRGFVHLYEHPLSAWTEVPGSKMKPLDIARVPRELLKIHLHYRSSVSSRK